MFTAPAVVIEVTRTPDGKPVTGVRLLAPLRCAIHIDGWPTPTTPEICIPKGFVSDGASVPRFFWRLLSPPIYPVTLAPSIVHDYLYLHGARYGFTRLGVDRWYYFALRLNGYPLWKSILTYAALRLFGASHWSTT